MIRGGEAPPEAEGGHGAATHHGRFSLRPGPAAAVRAAMVRLLRLAGADAASRTGRAGEAPIHFLDSGRGPALVLLHGGGGGGANWYRLIPALSPTHRVLAPDLPGFGLTPALAPETAGPLSRTGAALLLRWLDGLGISSFDVAGTSYGGLLALRLAQARPQTVRRLILLDSAGLGAAMPWRVRLATLRGLRRLLARPRREGTRWLFRSLLVARPEALPAGHADALLEYLWASAAAAPPGWLARVLAGFGGLGGQREVVPPAELSAIHQPTLLVWGARDAFFPLAHARAAAEALPRGLLRVIPAAGHSPNWETPEEVAAAAGAFLPTRPPPLDASLRPALR